MRLTRWPWVQLWKRMIAGEGGKKSVKKIFFIQNCLDRWV